MDSKNYIRACALFMFDQGKSTKENTQVISDLYPAELRTVVLPNSEQATGLSRTSREVDALKSSIVNL
jgi:hypothetical protein